MRKLLHIVFGVVCNRISSQVCPYQHWSAPCPSERLGGKLWELRMKSKTGIARSIYVLEHEKRIIILHTFVKKTQKTPKLALDIAMKRRKKLKT